MRTHPATPAAPRGRTPGRGPHPQLTVGTANTADHKKSYLNNRYEQGTDRLTRSFVTDDTHGYQLQDLNYSYDQVGNVTSIADPTTLGGTSSAETQCFAYDGHRRLIEAWTPSSQKCSDPRNANSQSGPAPYWSSYTYNKAGQRDTETTHKPAGDSRTTYCYARTDQPHFLTGTTASGDCASPQKTYTPDATGNTIKRPGASGTQDLAWSEEGRLAKLTESGKATDYVYDAAGELLIRNSAGGERVLYTGSTELHLRANGTTWAQRHYKAGGQTVAVRSTESGTNRLTYLAGDHHGTSSLAINADTAQTHTKRFTSPFGAERGKPTGSPWPDDKGFLGKTTDKTTGLTHIGARQYDPAIGQFISVDPILSPSQPQSLNGYSYANNTPITQSDPTGLFCDGCSANNPDTAWTPDNGPGCTHYACYDRGGNVQHQVRPDGGGGGGGGTASTGSSGNTSSGRRLTIFPGVTVDASWKYAHKYKQAFRWEIDNWCQGDADCLVNPEDAEQAEAYRLRLTHLKFLACMRLGHESGCMGKVTSLGVAMAAMAATGAAGGEGPGTFNGGGSQRRTNLTRGEKVAAAAGVGDLSPALRKNLTGFMKKSPGDAEIPQIIRLPGGGAEFSYKVPGRVPGSYAVYRKRVDPEGVTELAYRTTFLPDGSIAHIKFK